MNAYKIPRTIVNQLLAQSQHQPEEETCGLVSQKHGLPQRVYPVDNIAGEKTSLFEMDPKQQVEAMKQMREQGEELFAIYHSHPHAPAQPSQRDLLEAGYPEALYLIISLDTKGVLDLRGFVLTGKEFEAVKLEI